MRLVLVALLASCTGQIGEPGVSIDDMPPPFDSQIAVGPSPTLRLTALEYEQSLRIVFGDAVVDDVRIDRLPSDGSAGPFASNAFFDVSEDGVEAYRAVAEEAGARVVQDLASVFECDVTTPAPDCVERFISSLGRRLYRRPLREDEVTAYAMLFDSAFARGGSADGVRLVVTAMLQSPTFLYRLEVGEATAESDVRKLIGYEVASRLSFYLWKSGPDDALLAAAEAGELATPEQLHAQARRMLDDPRSDATIVGFHEQWLGISDVLSHPVDEARFPEFFDLKDDMLAETRAFTLHVMRDGDARLETLLTAQYSFVSPELGTFYGISGLSGTGEMRVDLDPTQRAGVLTHASFLTAHTNDTATAAVHRGLAIRESFLCQSLPLPPPVDTIIAPDPTASARQQLEQKTSPDACAGCHVLMNPVGFLFENYDAIGTYRTMDGMHPIDATGDLANSDVDGDLEGAVELATALAGSDQVRQCLTRQWLRYALGRPDVGLDDRSVEAAHALYAESDHDLRELIVFITGTDAFLHRRIPSN